MYNDWELAVRVCARAITTCNTVHLYYCPIHYPFSPRSLEMILLKIFLVILSIVIVALFSFQWCKQFVYLFSVSVGSLVQVRLVPAPVLDSLRVFFCNVCKIETVCLQIVNKTKGYWQTNKRKRAGACVVSLSVSTTQCLTVNPQKHTSSSRVIFVPSLSLESVETNIYLRPIKAPSSRVT